MATGLIDVGIIKPELAGSFAAGYRGAEQSRQQLAQEKQQTELGQMKLEQLKQDRASLLQLQDSLKAAGKDPDPIKVFDALIATGNPDYVMKGIDGKRRLTELQRADSMLRQYAPELFGAEPANALAPAAPTGTPSLNLPAGAQPPGDYTSTQAMGRVPGVVTTPIPESPPMNAMAPTAAPVNAMAPAAGGDVNALRRQLVALSSIDDPRAKAMADVIKGQITEASKPYVVGGRLVTGGGKELYAAPEKPPAPPAMVAEYTFAKTPEGGGFRGTYQEFVTARAAAGRAPAQPVAPTITQIQDPTNPLQMITIDARRYTGGGVGSPGVIGTTGKSAPAAAAAQKQEQGATQAQDILDNLKYAYEELDRQRAIPSTQRGAISNILTSIGTSGVGQVAGRVTGSEAQTQRDIIASARNQLFAAVKNATGLSAQNLNSNVEFTTWLNSLTDPSKSIEANREILANMEKFIGSGGKYSARQSGGQFTPAASTKPAPAGSKPSVAPPAGFTVD